MDIKPAIVESSREIAAAILNDVILSLSVVRETFGVTDPIKLQKTCPT